MIRSIKWECTRAGVGQVRLHGSEAGWSTTITLHDQSECLESDFKEAVESIQRVHEVSNDENDNWVHHRTKYFGDYRDYSEGASGCKAWITADQYRRVRSGELGL